MIWRLTYCNKDGVEARLDIIRGASTPVEAIEGTATPFILNYKLDKSDKSGFFMTSSADISIFETPTFNIDNLKTSNETEIKVEHYINNVLDWSGFVIPDFFSKTIGTPATVEMAASDRLGTLKGVTLDNLPAKISLRNLLTQSLAKTGLTLTLNTQVQLTHGTTNILDTEILSQRLKDNKGRNISCYDIIKSILVATNSTIRQKKGTWQVYNKLEHEAQTASVSFDDVMVGARRTIQPVASSVGVFHEFGGDRLYPDNFNFQSEAINWTAVNGFVMSFDNREVLGYELSGGSYIPVYGAPTDKKYLVNTNDSPSSINTDFNTSPYIKTEIPIVSGYSGSVKITVDINVSGYRGSLQRYQLLAKKGSKILSLNFGGGFEPFNNTDPLNSMWISFPMVDPTEISTISRKVTGTLEDEDLTGYVLELRLYGLKLSFTNFISLSIRNNSETASGNIYKTEQGADFTKIHDIDTSIFGDYILKGLNGYFYDYPLDDTSSLLLSTGELTTPSWTAYGSEDTLPLLQHVSRQKSKLFSIAHDILVADIDLPSFNPLAVYEDCNGKRYTIISAKYDFFRSQVSVELEQALVDNTIQKRDYIYSYFGDGETGVKSIGGISAGASGGTGIDSGLIGGINERIDDVNDKVNNIKVGPANLLLNTGFLGDFQSLTVDALTAVTGSTPISTNPLAHWVYSSTEVVDAPSRSGKGVKIGSIQQTVTLKQGSHVLSFWAKGNSLTVDLAESVPVSIDSEYKKYSFDITVANSGAHTFSLSGDAYIYEIMLSEGNADVSYSYSEEDDLKAIAQLQAINVITDAIKNYDTDILGGLILTSMIQLGKYKDGIMEKVTSGINGIYNNDGDPAIWAGGSFDDAIRTVQRLIDNPNNEPTQAEWAEMANIVMTHGGDGFFKGYIYALGGYFRGKVESNFNGNKIVIDPQNRMLSLLNDDGKPVTELSFTPLGTGLIRTLEYHANGNRKNELMLTSSDGISMKSFDETTGAITSQIRYTAAGAIQNANLINLTDEAANAALASGEFYRTGNIVKVKI